MGFGKDPGAQKGLQQQRPRELLTWCGISTAKPRRLKFIMLLPMKRNRKKIEGELNEGDSTSKEKDRNEGNEAEGANGGSIKVKLRKLSPTRKRTKRSFIRS